MNTGDRAQLILLYEEGLTYKEIAARTGKPATSVQSALAGHVIPRYGVKVRQAAALRAQGMPWAEVATRCGYGSETAARVALCRHRARQRALDAAESA